VTAVERRQRHEIEDRDEHVDLHEEEQEQGGWPVEARFDAILPAPRSRTHGCRSVYRRSAPDSSAKTLRRVLDEPDEELLHLDADSFTRGSDRPARSSRGYTPMMPTFFAPSVSAPA